MKERQHSTERVNWWQRGAGVLFIVAGIDLIAGAETLTEAAAGAGGILAGAWFWKESKSSMAPA